MRQKADPPYLITCGTYNDGKRGFKGWSEREEKSLLTKLDNLNNQGVKFALSNVLGHKGKENEVLKTWVASHPRYNVNCLNSDYSNCNYQKKDRNASAEVLITNYNAGN